MRDELIPMRMCRHESELPDDLLVVEEIDKDGDEEIDGNKR